MNFSSNINASSCAKSILSMHIIYLSLLKDVWWSSKPCFWDCYCNGSLDLHCCSYLASCKSQAHYWHRLSRETHVYIANEILNSCSCIFTSNRHCYLWDHKLGKYGFLAFKLEEELDILQFIGSMWPCLNGFLGWQVHSRLILKLMSVWFRVLTGNCKTVFNGLLIELLGGVSSGM